MHRDPESTPDELTIEKQRFIKHKVKEYFDEVYIAHGRGLKPDLFVAQWNHMAYFDELHLDRGHLPPSTRTGFAHGAADERWGLPPDLWARGESMLWYCNWGTTQNTKLDKQYAGDTVLYGKLIRALAAGKPYIGEQVRLLPAAQHDGRGRGARLCDQRHRHALADAGRPRGHAALFRIPPQA